jgi:amino acid adenylation domain-containing protein
MVQNALKNSAALAAALGSEANVIASNGRPSRIQREKKPATTRLCPLSFAQRRIWFFDQLEPHSAVYNIPIVVRLHGSLDRTALEQALDAVVERHESLRTRFVRIVDEPAQFIDEAAQVELRRHSLRMLPTGERQEQMEHLVRAEVNRPFDLTQDNLLRSLILELASDENILVLTIHHIISDEWSLEVFFREISRFYEGYRAHTAVRLPELRLQYADYAAWQRKHLRNESFSRQIEFWKTELVDTTPPLELPSDFPRRGTPSFRGASLSCPLGRELSNLIRQLAGESKTTPYMLLLAAFKALLFRYTEHQDICVGSPFAGRSSDEFESIIGFFVNSLPLRTKLSGQLTFEQLLSRVKKTVLNAFVHQHLPLEKIVEEVQPERSYSHTPFTKLIFLVHGEPLRELRLAGISCELLDYSTDTAKFDATLFVRERADGFLARLEYNTDLFLPETAGRLLQHYATLLEGAVTHPATLLSALPLLSGAEKHQLITEWNSNSTGYPQENCLHELFEIEAERAPGAPAVACGSLTMTYGELNRRATQLAQVLSSQYSVGPDKPVGICFERGPEMFVAMLGVLKAGGAYVPLDPCYPKERLAFMVEDSGAAVVLTQRKLVGFLPANKAGILCLDTNLPGADRNAAALFAKPNPSNLAYIVYTSGSTGSPKGVAVPHRAVTRLVCNTNYVHIGPNDRLAQISNISFDAATFEIWGPLLNGGQCVVINQDVVLESKTFANELRTRGITIMFLTTALFNHLATEAPGAFENLHTLLVGGEVLDPQKIRLVLNDRPPRHFLSVYGPTENTTFTCFYEITQVPKSAISIPIGRPIANTEVYILDSSLNPVPIGVYGELHTGGDGLARGYWNRPDLTASRFIPNPFPHSQASACLYKTGDLARYLPDGNIEFLGRTDHQVKIRGFRIELDEIASCLKRHPDVADAAVVVQENQPGEKRLVACVIARNMRELPANALREFLETKLPGFMVPAAFLAVQKFPLTPNGKLDRKALASLSFQEHTALERNTAPGDATERTLADIWRRTLDCRSFGIRDNFFQLGGHSLLAVRVLAQIEREFGRKLRLSAFFQTPTIERLAALLRQAPGECDFTIGSSLVEIQSQGSRKPLFLVHGAGGGMFWGYVNLSRHLGQEQPVYAFSSRGLDGCSEFASIEKMAAHYIADLRLVQPHGPYRLGGYCFGGDVAYEMARQLHEQREAVAVLALLNSTPPHSRYSRIPWTPLWAVRFVRNLAYWANYVAHMDAAHRRDFFKWKWKLMKKQLLPSTCATCKSNGSDVTDLVDLSQFTAEERALWEAHLRALFQFRPQPYSGGVHLFRSNGHPLWSSLDSDYGWGELAAGGVTTTIIPGAHEQIMEEPFVEVLAAELAKVLNENVSPKTTTPVNGCIPSAKIAVAPLSVNPGEGHCQGAVT